MLTRSTGGSTCARIPSAMLDTLAHVARGATRTELAGRDPAANRDAGLVRGLAADVRWAGRTDRGHATHARGRASLDRTAAVPLRAFLLHSPTRTGGATARHLRRLVAERHQGCLDRGHLVRATRRC